MRVNYVKYHKDTGEIRQWGDCAVGSPILDSTYFEGDLLVLQGNGTNASHYVQIPELDIVAKPTQPSQYHVFNYETKQWVLSGVLAWESIRAQRDKLLAACDWTVMPDVPMPDYRKEAWVVYRQALRDITDHHSPLAVDWPAPPN